ncbi:hypothetical protein [Zoogloea sp.]|uniref:hypothetical protein n=1 Tax=Zoogloea sp. TaxID=49181 RepID=UPI001415E405|nr:MAG: hypothetical protein F9K15_21890 [Zoogloea sp.]
MARELVQVFVIQCKSTGEFLREDLTYSRFLTEAGRLHDVQEASETARDNLDYDYVISSFWEMEKARLW